MRTIKFRGKKVGNNEWVYGDLVCNAFFFKDKTPSPYILVPNDNYANFESMVEGNDIFPVIPETVGQFTGLKDCNGKDIYEGDILQYSFAIPPLVGITKVEYDGCAFMVKTPKHNPKEATLFTLINSVNVEVISNIHEQKDSK